MPVGNRTHTARVADTILAEIVLFKFAVQESVSRFTKTKLDPGKITLY